MAVAGRPDAHQGHDQHLSTAYPNRYYASTYGRQAATWIRDTWAGLAAGRSDVTTELFTGCTTCSTQPSVLLTVKGAELPGEVVVIGGHIDSICNTGTGDSMRAPGADDDASGTATVTEVLRVALKDGWKPKRTVVFAGYAAEEVGLRGSDAVARSFKAQGKNVVGVMQLDMTNYDPGNGIDMAFLTDNVNAGLTSFGKQLFDTYLKPSGLVRGDMTCGYACSDHASWTSAGYPAMMAAEPEIFPSLHTTGDTLANLGNTAQPRRSSPRWAWPSSARSPRPPAPSPRPRRPPPPRRPRVARCSPTASPSPACPAPPAP
ncbi:M20/M25/M40 family metallo-hydrolase [Arsenicicoccus sp. oral taxon 190]|uniref:M20/M25/M40 family metallo-hydrolase n=1 Tax=Arsenicicoccus sp. oral taxon 190 TaxID=1658671 RepID=UPI00067CBB77|nr:M20/M25/M40 family metallo-hydrolase [Arsenicicoccus sp. oral taxon 190]